MENNKALEKELIEETGVSQTEMTKYLEESVHLKEDKRKNLFRWYLEKKLSRMESGALEYFLTLLNNNNFLPFLQLFILIQVYARFPIRFVFEVHVLLNT